MGANHGLPVVPSATVSVATTAVHGNQSTASSSLLVTPTLSESYFCNINNYYVN